MHKPRKKEMTLGDEERLTVTIMHIAYALSLYLMYSDNIICKVTGELESDKKG